MLPVRRDAASFRTILEPRSAELPIAISRLAIAKADYGIVLSGIWLGVSLVPPSDGSASPDAVRVGATSDVVYLDACRKRGGPPFFESMVTDR
jgi:hypothetical protein